MLKSNNVGLRLSVVGGCSFKKSLWGASPKACSDGAQIAQLFGKSLDFEVSPAQYSIVVKTHPRL